MISPLKVTRGNLSMFPQRITWSLSAMVSNTASLRKNGSGYSMILPANFEIQAMIGASKEENEGTTKLKKWASRRASALIWCSTRSTSVFESIFSRCFGLLDWTDRYVRSSGKSSTSQYIKSSALGDWFRVDAETFFLAAKWVRNCSICEPTFRLDGIYCETGWIV
jgi:hypothetical protein